MCRPHLASTPTYLPSTTFAVPLGSHRTTRIARSPNSRFKFVNSQKNPRVRKIRVRNSGAGKGSANFMDAWKNAFFLREKPMSIKFRVLRGGYFGFWGGGKCRFYFYGRADFLKFSTTRVSTTFPPPRERHVSLLNALGILWGYF